LSSRLGIALQAVAVAALAVVVYVAFLKPGDSDPLTEIQVDDGAQVEMSPPPARERDRRPPRAAKQPRKAVPRVTRSQAPSQPADAAPPEIADVETPAGSQYVSSVARIAQQANARN
jgi:hypothetical protein